MANILVLGAGVMGTAFTVPLADRGHAIWLVGTHLDTDIIKALLQSRHHPRLKITIPRSVQPILHLSLADVINDVDLVVIGVNSLGIDWAAQTLAHYLKPDIPLLFLTKGLIGEGLTLRPMQDVFFRSFPGGWTRKFAVVGGPSIAGELASRWDTSVVVAGSDLALLTHLKNIIKTDYYHIQISTDLIGVETTTALKNLYALGMGMVQGIQERTPPSENQANMYNLSAALFTQSTLEMEYLVEFMGGDRKSVYSLPGIGDLYVTSQGGRNATMGYYLGLGQSYKAAKREFMPEDTVEGAELALNIQPSIQKLVSSEILDSQRLPLLQHILSVVCEGKQPEYPWESFFRSDEKISQEA